jgi:pentatricopeptide repeat protein
MRRICQQSRRWHQQFFASASHLGHRHCLQQRWLPFHYQQRHYARRRSNDLVVHEYEQLGRDKKTRVAVNPKADIEETEGYFRSRLEKLENELAEMRKGPFAPDGEFMQSLSPEEREIALEALEKEGEALQGDLGDIDTAELDRLVEEQTQEGQAGLIEHESAPQVTFHPSLVHRAYIRSFNWALRDIVADSSSNKVRVSLWKSYYRCVQHIPNFLSLLPATAWSLLWESQVGLPNDARNIKALAEDMLGQSVSLSPEQVVVYIDVLRLSGDLSTAIKLWNENRSILGPDAQIAARFWSLGVQLYSEDNQPYEANKIAVQCLDRGGFVDATILLPLVAAWARDNTTDSLVKSWACYLRLKAELGTKIRPQDYETISTTLLKQGNSGMALAVFRDKLLHSAKGKHRRYDSLAAFQNLAGYVGHLQASEISEHAVSKVSVVALAVLPRAFRNKIFFAAWMKNLIGRGDIEAALQVVELMYEQGVRPDARHMNGIVGAWLREGSNISKDKAENLAWAMINARIDFVRQRETGVKPQKLMKSSEEFVIPFFVKFKMPPATIETFSILLVHYTRRLKDDVAHQLMDTMTTQAAIAPNSFILNHWMYASLRAHDLQSVWTQYQTMKQNIQPDLHTFACLWDAAKIQFDQSRAAHWKGFPSARLLFREMTDWMLNSRLGPATRARQEFSRDLYNQIVRVFCLSDDLRGVLCALHGLKQLFRDHPDSATVRIITIQIARRLPPDPGYQPTGRRGSRRRVSRMTTAMSAVNDILQIVTDQRAVSLMDAGLDPQRLHPAAAKQFKLDALSDFLLVIMERLVPEAGQVHNEVWMTAQVMGVGFERVHYGKKSLAEPDIILEGEPVGFDA